MHLRKSLHSLFWDEMSYRYQLGLIDPLYHLKFAFPCYFLFVCLFDLSMCMSGVLKSPTIIVLWLISPFIHVSICLIYCGAPTLGAYIFKIVISSSWLYPFIIIWCPSLSLFTAFILKSNLSDMIFDTPAFFWSLLEFLFTTLHFQSVCVPCFEVGLL